MFFCNPATDAFDQHTARECTALMSAGDSGFSETRWQGMVEGFALAPHLDKLMTMRSTGSKRKVWLAAALASGRALVLLDEPTDGLASPSIGCLWGELTRAAGSTERAIVIASAERLDRIPLVGSIGLPLG